MEVAEAFALAKSTEEFFDLIAVNLCVIDRSRQACGRGDLTQNGDFSPHKVPGSFGAEDVAGEPERIRKLRQRFGAVEAALRQYAELNPENRDLQAFVGAEATYGKGRASGDKMRRAVCAVRDIKRARLTTAARAS